ncbi:MAG: efflux RND transporter periplasmic adaptor subunit [Acetobacteraceae bacterium]|nr:efflux RND transporter periplasmic adaptor subunit [Acetobacteraceae bacterium]
MLTQVVVLAALAGAGAAWQVYGSQVGLPPPAQLLGLSRNNAAQQGRSGAPAGVPVVVAPVRTATVTERVETVGTARAREAVTVTTRISGIVAAINFSEGQAVKAGDVLVELDRQQVTAELDQARASLDDARQQLARARALRPTQAVAEARIDQLEAGARGAEARVRQVQARIEEMKIVAPFAGRVGIRQVSLGALVPPGAVVTTLDDLSRMRIEFSVPELFIARLSPGMAVTAGSAAFGSRRFEGAVTVIDTRIDPATRAVRLISEFDNADGALRPGLFLNVELTVQQRADGMIIPEDAIDPVADKAFVYAVRQGRAERIEVRLGARLPGEVEVLSGLNADDRVVVRGLQRLRNGVAVDVTETWAPRAG